MTREDRISEYMNHIKVSLKDSINCQGFSDEDWHNKAAAYIDNVIAREERESQRPTIRVSYRNYKENYNECKTVPGSYDKKAKTIEIYKPVTGGKCPMCGGYCYGDCQAAK